MPGFLCIRFDDVVESVIIQRSEFRLGMDKILFGGLAEQAAEAAQYRETLRIEERIATDSEYRRTWEGRQIMVNAFDEEEQ